MDDLFLLSPEILVTLVAFIIFSLDMAWQGDERSSKYLPWLAFGTALAAIGLTVLVWVQAESRMPFAIATDLENAVPMLAMDKMALFFKMFAMLTVAIVGLSAVDYIQAHTPFRGEFYALTLLTGLSLMLLSSATNLIMIYLALEFLSITSYLLTGYLRQDDRSTEAAMKYLLYGALASGVMLYGFSLLYGATGSVDLVTIAQSLGNSTNLLLIVIATMMILVGFGFKIALVPFHQWSPDAYEGAPTPITAFLSVGPKAAGLAVLIRVLVVALPAYEVSWTGILVVISILTMTLGNLVALWQSNVKRLLAYSSIAQAGYMLIGLAAYSANPDGGLSGGLNGILLYLLAYLFTNLGIFAVAIVLENKLGTSEVSDYAGLVRRSPFLSIALLVFLLSLIGIPPTGGFMGKLFVFGAALDQQLYALALIGVLNSALSVYYYFALARQAFFTEAEDESPIQPSPVLGGVVGVMMVMTLLIALNAEPFIDFATTSTQVLAATSF